MSTRLDESASWCTGMKRPAEDCQDEMNEVSSGFCRKLRRRGDAQYELLSGCSSLLSDRSWPSETQAIHHHADKGGHISPNVRDRQLDYGKGCQNPDTGSPYIDEVPRSGGETTADATGDHKDIQVADSPSGIAFGALGHVVGAMERAAENGPYGNMENFYVLLQGWLHLSSRRNLVVVAVDMMLIHREIDYFKREKAWSVRERIEEINVREAPSWHG
ncbi:hypothetical protein BU25DRAFT_417044 [Macroventuria anomochaeta]|uniref:Uncharacterized protein n=1 Tax=Macroventuria anomochaeta TaxID=301207 RepID=A0ACB6SJQ1_9PLEO|nr:uncharacterized protein BU25DRAFT_417044 [Macroventuria anomochaeta]KAF2633912.1 hypothetical protein BU25DRAFT_417044 [Macroventuria anomochaeta]